jgi:hypothetical protein
METAMTRTDRKYWKVGGILLTATLAALIGGMSALPARADNDDRGRNDQRDQPRPSYRAEAPRHYEERRYVYAPPPVYYAAPPRRPAIDFIFPFEIR